MSTENSSRSHIGVTLTPMRTSGPIPRPSKGYSGWSVATPADHDVPTGRYTPGNSKGDKVWAGFAVQGGMHTFEREYDRDVFRDLQRRKGDPFAVEYHRKDNSGRRIESLGEYKGLLKGITPSGKDASSGDPILITVRVEMDGEVVL